MGHEYVGIVEEIGDAVQTLTVGDFVVGSFCISDNTCEIYRAGYQSRCVHGQFVAGTIGTQAKRARIPYADGTLVATPGQPDPDLVPSLLATSDVLGTGWFAAVAAEASPGKTAPVRRFLPEMIDLIWRREIDPGKVFDLTLPLDQAAEGYKAMDERRAIKTMLTL